MSREEVVAVAVRLFAVALFVYALRTVPSLMLYWNQNIDPETFLPFLTVLLMTFGLVAALWFFPRAVAKHLLPKRLPEDEQWSWSEEGVLQASFTILGVYFFYYGISDTAYWFSLVIVGDRQFVDGVATEFSPDQKAAMVATAIEVVVAAVLIFGSAGLARMLTFIRFGRGHRLEE